MELKVRIKICVSGGCIVEVQADRPEWLEVRIVDYDNGDSGAWLPHDKNFPVSPFSSKASEEAASILDTELTYLKEYIEQKKKVNEE